MISDARRQELLKEYFSARVGQICDTYSGEACTSEQVLARERLRRCVAAVCHNLPQGSKILDVGSGCGLAASTLADLGYDVTAVELIPELVDKARQTRSEEVNWVCSPFGPKNATRGSFDAVLSLAFLEYQERAGKTLVNMRKMLKPGGLLLLSVPNTLSAKFHFGLSRALYRLTEPPETPIRHSFTPERLQRLLGMAGFIFMDYEWLPQGEGEYPLCVERARDMWKHRVKFRTAAEFLTLSRSYRPEDTEPGC